MTDARPRTRISSISSRALAMWPFLMLGQWDSTSQVCTYNAIKMERSMSSPASSPLESLGLVLCGLSVVDFNPLNGPQEKSCKYAHWGLSTQALLGNPPKALEKGAGVPRAGKQHRAPIQKGKQAAWWLS